MSEDLDLWDSDVWREAADDTFAEACRSADEKARRVNGRAPRDADHIPFDDVEDVPLPYVDLALELKPREWLVPERIPMRSVSMLGGEGAIGKSLLLMQLSGAVVLGKDWISTLPEPGPVLYMSCEEDDDEVRRRMESVAKHLGSSRQEIIDHGLRFLSFAGKDAILGQPDRFGIIRPTPLFERLHRDALAQRPKLIVTDTVADIFGGKENDRAQTRQFITMLRGLAIDVGAAVVMAAHPSLTGIATDTGLSGNTGWHNSVRARMYFKPAPGDDATLRVLEVKKNNYGPVNETILLRWRDGVYVVEPGKGTLERLAFEAEHDHLFLKLLRRFTEQGRNVSDKSSPTYAPSLFADEPEAKAAKVGKRDFAEAMSRLFTAGKIRIVTIGSASRMRSRIVESEREGGPSNTPSNGLPTPSNGVLTHTPYTPMPVGSGQRALEAPARSNGKEGKEDAEPVWWS
jgi:RecA-family ATPase